jgi:hypothetical protein
VKAVEFRDASLPGYELGSRGIRFVSFPELTVAEIRSNIKKGIILYKEQFMCAVVTGDCNKSVARIRLVKTENSSVYATVNSKAWK